MNIKVIKNDKEHAIAMKEVDKLIEIVMDKGESNTPNNILEKIELLGILINDYEDKRWPIERPDPLSAIKFAMEQKDLRPVDMKEFFGSTSRFYEILNHKRNLSLSMIKKLHTKLHIPYECLIV
jgi:HTH-type transcriptional regulator / antitoxin HigA